jgi:hypothetical protein
VVIKTREEKGLISDLAETINNMRKFKMKPNLRSACLVYPKKMRRISTRVTTSQGLGRSKEGSAMTGPPSRRFQKTMTCSPRHRKFYL